MKTKQNDRWQVGILTVLAIAMLASLLLPESWIQKTHRKRVEISILPRQTDSEIWSMYRQGMEQAAEDYGAELRFLIPTENNDANQQLETMQREMKGGADALIVAPIDNGQISEQLEQFRGLPVVCIETPVDGAAANIVPDNGVLVEMLVQQVVQECPSQGRLLLVNWSGQCDGIFQRLNAVQQELTQQGFDVQVAETPTLQQLQQSDGIICFEQQAVHTVLRQLEQSTAGAKVYSCGAAKPVAIALEQKKLQASAIWSEYVMGYLAVQQATAEVRNHHAKDYLLPISLVKKGETYDSEYQKLLYPISH